MSKIHKTYIYCLDEYRAFSEDIRKRFSDSTRYNVSVFNNAEDIIKAFPDEKPGAGCRILIIGVYDSKESYNTAENLIEKIKKVNPETGILIIVVNPDKTEDARRELRFNIDSFIPRNSSMVLRVHNAVKKLISEHNLVIYRRRRNISLVVLACGLILSLIIFIIARIKFPLYF
ncbi:MAG TPA: hypothetical protein PLN06_00210 [Bacteroidales bacterium]|nr:hypothetical protein [Bacteroidales bacterium]HQG35735.1 hypothetical protein [Bacteroidales bacterium]HQG52293.1 hypothetical protein [Bacteroidales bacterium]HQJ19789.1 hypothetical protein [Bacteroidales bacterium]